VEEHAGAEHASEHEGSSMPVLARLAPGVRESTFSPRGREARRGRFSERCRTPLLGRGWRARSGLEWRRTRRSWCSASRTPMNATATGTPCPAGWSGITARTSGRVVVGVHADAGDGQGTRGGPFFSHGRSRSLPGVPRSESSASLPAWQGPLRLVVHRHRTRTSRRLIIPPVGLHAMCAGDLRTPRC
jgi:hypothetical protein